MRTDYDSPWKLAIETYFQDFIAFFLPEAASAINWAVRPEFLEQELQQIIRDASLGKHIIDKLVKVQLREGGDRWLLIHVEVQSRHDPRFAQRMFTYHYRLYDLYQQEVVSLAILGDASATWRPQTFGYENFGCWLQFGYPTVKLRDYENHWDSLTQDFNPFATVVMAHLKTLSTVRDLEERCHWKTEIIKSLLDRNYSPQDIKNLFRFVDWLMELSPALEQRFQAEIARYQAQENIPYLSQWERDRIAQGLEQGIDQGVERGLMTSLKLILRKFGDVAPELSQILESLHSQTWLEFLIEQGAIAATQEDLLRACGVYGQGLTDGADLWAGLPIVGYLRWGQTLDWADRVGPEADIATLQAVYAAVLPDRPWPDFLGSQPQ